MDRARLVYRLVTGMDMNIRALISGQISTIAQSNSSRLGFPTLITAICRARGVTSDSLTYKSLSPTINLAYIKKSCWNVDDLTANFKGARKARARPVDVPSSSAPPAPSTFATPTPTPLGPSAQESQRFEAMLQSLHQGQILLMQSLQVVAPPGSIMSVEQFMEKVSWPEILPSIMREGGGPSAQVPQQVHNASSEAIIPGAFDFSGGGLEMRLDEATSPKLVPVPADPPSIVVDPSSPAPEAPLPSTPLIISKDPTIPVPGLATTPPATPVIYFSDEKEGWTTTPPGTPVLHLDDEE